MLLAIDTGNTNTLFAIHDGDKWLVEWRIATDETILHIHQQCGMHQ